MRFSFVLSVCRSGIRVLFFAWRGRNASCRRVSLFPGSAACFCLAELDVGSGCTFGRGACNERGEREQAGRFDGTASAARNRTVLERCEGLYHRAAQELASVAVRSVAYPAGTDARGIGMAADRGRLSVCQAGQCQARLRALRYRAPDERAMRERPASIRFWGRSAEKLLPGKNRVSRSSRSSGGPGP